MILKTKTNKETAKTGQGTGLTIKVIKSLKMLSQLSCWVMKAGILLLGERKNQQSSSLFWEKSSLSHLNRVCVCSVLFYYFSQWKKLTSRQLAVQLCLCGGGPGMRWEKATAHPNTDADCTL